MNKTRIDWCDYTWNPITGIGGFTLGFIEAGFEVVAGVEWDPCAALTYMMNCGSYPVDIRYVEEGDKDRLNKEYEKQIGLSKNNVKIVRPYISGSGWISNYPEYPSVRHFWFGDIRKIKGEDMLRELDIQPGELDCVSGSPPCQGFTYANKKRCPEDPRNNLVFEFARLVLELQPKTFVMENVPGMVNMLTPEGIPVIDALCKIFSDNGFSEYNVLRKSILSQAGCAAVIKIKSAPKVSVKKSKKVKGERQMEMFSVAAK